MSFKEWKMKFYPKSAFQIVDEGATEEELLEHALLKWKGLREEERRAYGLIVRGMVLYEDNDPFTSFGIDGHSCSLCEAYASSCFRCPIGQFLPPRQPEEACSAEYKQFLHTADPEPMISLLEKVLSWVEGGKSDDNQTS